MRGRAWSMIIRGRNVWTSYRHDLPRCSPFPRDSPVHHPEDGEVSGNDSATTTGPARSATEEDAGAEHEAEVVPVPVVVDLVEVHVVGEQRDDEGDGGDEAVPEPEQEP